MIYRISFSGICFLKTPVLHFQDPEGAVVSDFPSLRIFRYISDMLDFTRFYRIAF